MPVEDIGYIIFVQLLGMTQYPGAPFTANIIRDLIMFLFIPSVFILLVIYMILGRLFAMTIGAQVKLRILVGVAIYLFIVAGGYYPVFAYLAGPYFIFLIFILGLLYFLFSHFGAKGEAPGGSNHYPEGGSKIKELIGVGELMPDKRKYLEKELEKVNLRIKKLEHLAGHPGADKAVVQLDALISERAALEEKLYGRIRTH